MRRYIFSLSLLLAISARSVMAMPGDDLLVCGGLVSLRSPLMMSLTASGNAIIDSAIAQIEAFQGRPTTQVHEIHSELIPLLVRTGLRWSEISAISTPRGYEAYISNIETGSNLNANLMLFLQATIGQNHQLAGHVTTHELAILFLRQLKAALNPSP